MKLSQSMGVRGLEFETVRGPQTFVHGETLF